MADEFERLIAFVLKHEGGYSNDPRDAGGETKFGISKRAYPGLDIKNLTEDEAKEIYKRDYWDKAGCNALKWPLCFVVFDTAVNCGVGRATELRAFAADWTDYLFKRIGFYASLKKPEFLRGWILRVLDLRETIKNEAR